MTLEKPRPTPRTPPNKIVGDKDLLVAVGEALFGDRWHSGLAPLCGISRSHLSGIMAGTKALTPKTLRTLRKSLIHIQADVQDDARYRVTVVAEAIFRFPD